ncbi:glycerate kinase [Ramlibacter sp.]|uniref:glycerate kinase n=1 Tax=Ramlibacter sp. TaxID=1917967 RepID=UPI0017E8FE8F|nr:glycerate kinase [Ramlibacter sp.]MBA2676374.1 glycerate kinase [Ramlibacter sp.]
MNFQKVVPPILGVVLVAAAYRGWGWAGVGLAATGIVMWMLLHFTRLMKVLQRASSRPVGHCDSAVMLNAKLRPGVNLLHVVAMTRALGELVSPKEEPPEIYRWTDPGQSFVDCEFANGKLHKWELTRPPQAEEAAR